MPKTAKEQLNPARFAALAAALLGLGFAFALPPLQLNDEHGHFVRAYQISRGDWRGDPAPLLPRPVLDLLQRYPEGIDTERKLPPSEIAEAFRRPAERSREELRATDDPRHRYLTWSILASSLYCPVVYLPAAAGIAGARAIGLSPAGMMYAARIGNVLVFAAALWAALRLAPGSRILIALIGLMPMTLHQAGGVSADLMTIAVSLAGFALILRTRAVSDRRLLLAVAVLTPVWVLCKTSVWALPLLFLIPQSYFRNRRQWALFVGGVAVLSLAALALWQHAIHNQLLLFRADRLARGMDTSANGAFLAAHPLRFTRMMIAFLGGHVGEHAGQFIAAFGWAKLMPPLGARIFFFVLILAAALFDPPGRPIPIAERVAFGALFLATAFATYIVLFTSDGVVTPAGAIDFPYSAGVQGRYFIPFCLAGFLALRQNRLRLPPSVLRASLYGAAGLDLVLLALLWNHYFV